MFTHVCMNVCAMVLMASACLRTSSLACWSAVLCRACRITSSRYESTVPLCTRTVCDSVSYVHTRMCKFHNVALELERGREDGGGGDGGRERERNSV